MAARYSPMRWWPGDTPFEVMVGAILTQNTAWTNVEKAIAKLKERRLLNPRRLANAPLRAIESAIRSSGYFRQKARRLRDYCRWYVNRWGANPAKMRAAPDIREQLLARNGIGPETADSIVLYALDLPRFVVDAYTRRILSRHELVPANIGYDDLQAIFERALPRQPALYNEFHALFVAVGKNHCRSTPDCETCPLRRYLPR